MKYYFLALGTIVFVCVGCALDGQQAVDKGHHHAPPASLLAHPGPMVEGPGPGVMPMLGPPPQGTFSTQTTQIRFVGPPAMQVGWQVGTGYAENQLTTPGRYNFAQGVSYRLKLTSIPGRDGLVLYPTLQVYPSHPTTDAYLAHNSVPLEVNDEDLDQVEANNFVSKVIYLPDPKFQELAIAGVETLVSTRLEPGVDPVAEADRRGTVLAVLRVGNMDMEMPNQAEAEANAAFFGAGTFQHVSHQQGAHVPPVPISGFVGQGGVPGPMMMGSAHGAGKPPYNPISGVGGAPQWGTPLTSTPIGLPGPPHLPLGGPASLKSHTMRNLTKQDIPKPVDHFLYDVEHKPGLSLPRPVKHVQYSETHPTFKPGTVSYPNYALPQR